MVGIEAVKVGGTALIVDGAAALKVGGAAPRWAEQLMVSRAALKVDKQFSRWMEKLLDFKKLSFWLCWW